MATNKIDEDWANFCADLPDKPYLCPVCYAGFDTSEEKSKHLEIDHEYETLENKPRA
jgi:hypothetical protein